MTNLNGFFLLVTPSTASYLREQWGSLPEHMIVTKRLRAMISVNLRRYVAQRPRLPR